MQHLIGNGGINELIKKLSKKTEQPPSDNRPVFSKEMKKTHTILAPMMLPIHFKLLQRIFIDEGYNMEILDAEATDIVEIGLKYTHNDTCYPAQLTIGLLLEAILSGRYDTDSIALLMMQTGGGCRASNYISLLRKGLEKAGYSHIPVISFNLVGLESNPGFKMTMKLIKKLMFAVFYGDLLMQLLNQTVPYEMKKGITEKKVDKWANYLCDLFSIGKALSEKEILQYTKVILNDFNNIETSPKNKIKVGVVGEIYIKFAPLGNNNLERFLRSEDCEVVVPGLMDFILYTIDAGIEDHNLYGTGFTKQFISQILYKKIIRIQKSMINAYETFPKLSAPSYFPDTKKLASDVVHVGTKMGEGWLLTGEMVELIEAGVDNIVCTQPFGCLPNHIVGRGMMRRIKEKYPESNIVAIDYDSSATRVNQENRIKLMLSTAKRHSEKRQSE